MASPKPTRVIVIGAGWFGLAAAKTYLSLYRSISLTIIDADSSVGGVWSASRLYPGLIADSCAANFDFSDFPMDEELGIDKWADLPAEKVHEYLERYVNRFDLRRRCRLNTRVLNIEKNEKEGHVSGWNVEVEEDCGAEGKKRESLVCDKLIIAAGVNSTPNLPNDVDWSNFSGPIMHSKDVGTRSSLLTSEAVHRVTVVGGNKSAVDVVSLCARAGKEVDWLISPSGYGPCILFEPRTKNGANITSIKLARASTITGPTILNVKGFWYWFLHSGKCWVGTWLLKWVFRMVTKEAMDLYRGNENTMKIAPDLQDLFWTPASPSLIHDKNLFPLIAQNKIHIHRITLSSLTPHSAILSNNQTLPSDAIIFATGWKTNHSSFFSSSLLPDLGFPIPLQDQTPEMEKYWNAIDHESMEKLRRLFPTLANPPKEVLEYDEKHEKKATTTPFRLFRGMVPPTLAAKGDRSIVVLGLTLNICVPIFAEVSSLWGVAYLENLPFVEGTEKMLGSEGEMERDVSLMNCMGWLRFRDWGVPFLDGSEVSQLFVDQMMGELGVRGDRKVLAAEREGAGKWVGRRVVGWVRGLWREWMEPYVGSDYRGLVGEYRERWGLSEGREKSLKRD